MLAAIVLLVVVGVCAGLGFFSEEHATHLRATALEARRWVLQKLDSLGPALAVDSDCDFDLETGFGEVRESLVDNGKRAAAVELYKPMRPIRRSVHRSQLSGGKSTHVSTGPPSEYGGLFDHTAEQLQQEQLGNQQEQQLPRPKLATAMSSSGARTGEGKAPPLFPKHAQRRGISFDANAALANRSNDHHETSSARGGFALSGISAFLESSADGDDDPAAAAAAAELGGDPLPAKVVAAFTAEPPGRSSYGGVRERRGNDQPIPEYVPPQKQGILSKATHRRTSSRGSAAAGVAGGSAEGRSVVARAGSVGLSVSPPDSSPFFSVRSPPKILPPVPAFAGVGGGDVSVPPPPPPSWNEGQGQESMGGGAETSCFESASLLPPPLATDVLSKNAGQPARGAFWPRHEGSGMAISPVPFASDNWTGAGPTTPKHGLHQLDGEVPSRRGSSLLAGPSPDGGNDSFSHIDYVTSFVADGMASDSGGGGKRDVCGNQREERAAVSVLPLSPAWSSQDDVNRGTGVRRRISPRAADRGGGGEAGSRSPRRGAGWAQELSPKRRRSLPGDDGGSQLRPLALTYSEDAAAAPSRNTAKGLKVDVGIVRQGSTGIGMVRQGSAVAVSLAKIYTGAKSPSARASNVTAGAEPPAESATAAAGQAPEEVLMKDRRSSQLGLRCSAPIYDRGRNMLGNTEGDGGREEKPPPPPPALPPTEKRGGLAGRRANAGDGSGPGGDRWGVEDAAPSLARVSSRKETLRDDGIAPTAGVREDGGTADVRLGMGLRAMSTQREGQHEMASEKNVRAGRDLSSSQAFAASLDLPFEQLELDELIGGGGFGQVYRGTWRGTPVAIKVLVPVAQRDLDEELDADFRAEVLMLAALRHPNVCLFMGACMVPPNRAIVTELLTRGSLWEALRADRIPEETVSEPYRERERESRSCAAGTNRASQFVTPRNCWPWSVIVKVAEGVACGMWYLHQHEPFPILHRDLKSANLLLDECFNVKICDFGLARLKAFTNSAAMTGNCGTVQWMAPEVLASEKYAEPADVYSFAIVCWELLSRACPYEGMSQIQVAVAVLNDSLRPEIPEWCPREFTDLIKNGWEQDPTKRPSFGDVLEFVRRNPSAASRLKGR